MRSLIPFLGVSSLCMGFALARPAPGFSKRQSCGQPIENIYEPGPHCENLCTTATGCPSTSAVLTDLPAPKEKRWDCGPTYPGLYEPGANCENLADPWVRQYAPHSNPVSSSSSSNSTMHGGAVCDSGCNPRCGPAYPGYYEPGPNCENTLYVDGQCGRASQYYQPGPNCENLLWVR